MRHALIIFALACAALSVGLLSASSASATVLCKVNESGCPSESVVENTESVSLQTAAKSIAFTNGSWTVTCRGGGAIKVTDAGGAEEVVEGEITGLSFSECSNHEGFPCVFAGATAKNLPYDVELEGTEGSGTMVTSGMSVEIKCQGVWCSASASAAPSFTFEGGTSAVLSGGGPMVGSCGSVTFSAKYQAFAELVKPSLYLVGGPHPGPVTRLCKVNSSPCPTMAPLVSQRHPIGTTLEGSQEGNSSFEFLYEGLLREPACESGSITGKSTEPGNPLIGEISALSFSKCGGGVCAVQAQGLAYKAEISKTTGGNGTLTLATGSGGTPKIEVNCGKSFNCVYKAAGVSFTVTGGNPAKLAVSQTLEKDAASEAECGSTMTWKATYKLTKPTPLYVTS